MKKKVCLLILVVLVVLSLSSCSLFIIGKAPSSIRENSDESQNEFRPIVFSIADSESKDFSKLTVLGGSKDDSWLKVSDFAAAIEGRSYSKQDFLDNDKLNGSKVDIDLVKGKEFFKLYSDSIMLKEVSSDNKPLMYVSQASGQETLTLEVPPFQADTEFIMGVNGDWEVQPRLLSVIEENKEYAADLDGDGIEEQVQLKENEAEETVEVYLIQSGTAKLIQKVLYAKPEEVKLMALDLNGDGTLELITQHGGSAGGIVVFEIKGSSISEVLSYDSGE